MTRINRQKIYDHISYTIKELSNDVDATEKTISRWIESGLPIVQGSKKPILLLGSDIKEFLRKKDSKKKVKLKRCEFYCFKCRAARLAKRGTIRKLANRKTGECRVCNRKMSRTIRPS